MNVEVSALLKMVVVTAALAGPGLASIAPAVAAQREGTSAQGAYRRIGLTPPSCDDSKRVVVRTLTDDASVRHEQLVHWTRHNFKGYQMKPVCALIQVR
ncbi:hypothetical protein HNR47_000944 [Methylopila jiangsuensis]|nr:hypothetical protein [Methylopila jiangsuensis]MDR6284961.1 hypothetical protein [Methylopila jiangsuensis]